MHPDHGRRGLGTELLRAAFSADAARGYAKVTLTTFTHIPWNAPFYAGRGFVPIEPEHYGVELAAIVKKDAEKGLRNRVAMARAL